MATVLEGWTWVEQRCSWPVDSEEDYILATRSRVTFFEFVNGSCWIDNAGIINGKSETPPGQDETVEKTERVSFSKLDIFLSDSKLKALKDRQKKVRNLNPLDQAISREKLSVGETTAMTFHFLNADILHPLEAKTRQVELVMKSGQKIKIAYSTAIDLPRMKNVRLLINGEETPWKEPDEQPIVIEGASPKDGLPAPSIIEKLYDVLEGDERQLNRTLGHINQTVTGYMAGKVMDTVEDSWRQAQFATDSSMQRTCRLFSDSSQSKRIMKLQITISSHYKKGVFQSQPGKKPTLDEVECKPEESFATFHGSTVLNLNNSTGIMKVSITRNPEVWQRLLGWS